jgi:hypothetical protein
MSMYISPSQIHTRTHIRIHTHTYLGGVQMSIFLVASRNSLQSLQYQGSFSLSCSFSTYFWMQSYKVSSVSVSV